MGTRVLPRLAASCGALILLVTGAPLSSLPVQAQATVTVQMHEFKFVLANGSDNASTPLTITAGDTVTWAWNESATDPMPNCDSPTFQPPLPVSCPGHTTTETSGTPLWDSPLCTPPDGKPVCPYSVTLNTPGTYKYYCRIHGGTSPNNPLTHMDGTIVVQAAPVVAESPWVPLFAIAGAAVLALSRRRRAPADQAVLNQR